MKPAFLIVVIVHGAFHALSFLRAFGLADIKGMYTIITPWFGLAWLAAMLLLWGYAALELVERKKQARALGALALLLSQGLIFYFWADTKMGTIPNLLILAALLSAYGRAAFQRSVDKETQRILARIGPQPQSTVKEEDIAELPAPVQQWLRRSGAMQRPRIWVGRVEQKAQMQLSPDQKDWHPATALQYTTVDNPAFIWTVDLAMSGLMTFRGRDKFVDGKGEMLIKINALVSIMNARGTKMDEGTMQRFLGEMAWFPSLALSPYLTWEAVDARTAKVTMTYKGTNGSGTFSFDEEGRFASFTALRYKGNEKNAQKHPWVLTVEEHRVFEGIEVPSKMKAAWVLDTHDWTWLQLEVTNVAYNEQALEKSEFPWLVSLSAKPKGGEGT